MIQIPPRPTRLLLALLAGLPSAAVWPAPADWHIGRGNWSGSLGVSFDQSNASGESGDSNWTGSSRRLGEFIGVQGSGLYVLDKRLVNASLGLQLGVNQYSSAFDVTGASTSSTDHVISYNFDANILEQKPYPMQLFANRNQSNTTQSLGTYSERTMENRGFSLQLKEGSFLKDWGGPWFSARFDARQTQSQDRSSYFGRTSSSDQTTSVIAATADKGFTNSDLKFRYLGIDQSTPVLTQGSALPGGESRNLLARRSNQSQTGSLLYNLDFGPGLNRTFDSGLSYSTRSGLLPSNTLAATESLSILHFQNLNTRYSYGFTRDEAGGATSTEHTGSFDLSHQLYQNLSTSLGLNVSHRALGFGTLDQYGGYLSQGYGHSLPGGGGLTLSWSGNYSRNSNDLSLGSISLLSEPHTAPLEYEPGFLLDKPFVIASSIQVFNVQTGVRVLLTAASPGGGAGDYRIVQEGNRVRIEPVYVYLGLGIDPNAPVKPGDKLEVDYTYEVDANLDFESRNLAYGVAVNYGWIGVTYQHMALTRNPLSGESRFLDSTLQDYLSLYMTGDWQGFHTTATLSHRRNLTIDQDGQLQEDTSRLSMQGNGRVLNMDANVNADIERFRSRLLGYDTRLLAATLVWHPEYYWDMTFGASASNTHYLEPEREFTMLAARSTLRWKAEGGWINTAFVEYRRQDDSQISTQTAMLVGARTSKGWGRLSMTTGVSLDFNQSGGTRSASQRFDITLTRSF